MSQTTEAFSRVKIDALLKDAGWNLTDGVSVLFEHVLPDSSRADYALCDRSGRPVAAVEAKRASVNPVAAQDQGRHYAEQLSVPFVSCRTARRSGSWTERRTPTRQIINFYSPAGPGTAVRPPSRGREGRRPRDGWRTPALATAHPAGLKTGPARRVAPLADSGVKGRRKRRAIAAAERPGRRISAFYLAGAGKERGFAAGRHFLATSTAVPDEGAALSGQPALNADAEKHRLVD